MNSRKTPLLLGTAVVLLAWFAFLSLRKHASDGRVALPPAALWDGGAPPLEAATGAADAGLDDVEADGGEAPLPEAGEAEAGGGEHSGAEGGIAFYGRTVRLLKLFGQTTYREATRDRPTGHSTYHAAGVVVDRSARPNPLYVVDSGNSRVLGFRALGICQSPPGRECTHDGDCEPGSRCAITPGRDAELIFGQPDSASGACNGDVNLGLYGPASARSLCLLEYPSNPNNAEQWQRFNFDVDAQGNLYLGDAFNNRVLRFNQPFSQDTTEGKGDTVPDLVLGQEDFTSNRPNRGMGLAQRDERSLNFEISWHTTTKGSVSVDSAGNVWVADLANRRVLRFPPGQKAANLVLGQSDFTAFNEEGCSPPQPPAFALDRLCHPLLAKVNPQTGALYVLDETGTEGAFSARLLLFQPPFFNGMAASRVIAPRYTDPVARWTDRYYLQATGLEFNRYTEGPYARGVFWLNEHNGQRTLLLDDDGNVVHLIGSRSLAEIGGDQQYAGCPYDIYRDQGLWTPGGSIGQDDGNNLYLANEFLPFSNVVRHRLPYDFITAGGQRCPPHPDARLLGPPAVTGHKVTENVGVAVFRHQLILQDTRRLLVWNDYLRKPWGAPADVVVGQRRPDTRDEEPFQLPGWSFHAIDEAQRLWMRNAHGPLMVFQLPLTAASRPLANFIELYWADTNTRVDYHADGVAFDPIQRKLWISDRNRHRLLRVSDYGRLSKLHVDMVLGQREKTGVECNQGRGQERPTASTLCEPVKLQFDRRGNLYVVENTYECHGNDRISVFLAQELADAKGLFPQLEARRIFNTWLTGDASAPYTCGASARNVPSSPVTLAFNSRNEAVIGNDGYYPELPIRHWRQLYFYRDPLQKQSPDATLRLPMGTPGDLAFDEQDHLIVQDHTWNRTWVLDLQEQDAEGHPVWLEPIAPSDLPHPPDDRPSGE